MFQFSLTVQSRSLHKVHTIKGHSFFSACPGAVNAATPKLTYFSVGMTVAPSFYIKT